jgi:tRNA U55 pseudouridine synthase TruB
VRAIADALGAHCRTIRRTAVGPFRVEDADETRVLAPLAALVTLPERALTAEEATLIRHGRPVAGTEEGPVALHHDGLLVAVARGDGAALKPETVLPAP